MSSVATAAAAAAPASRGSSRSDASVNTRRRYPAPEMVELRLRPAAATAPPTTDAAASSCSSSAAAAAAAAEHDDDDRVSVQLRWGVTVSDLRRLHEMHEQAYPLSYAASYYTWLLDHDACIALVALVTPAAYARCTRAAPRAAPGAAVARSPPSPPSSSSSAADAVPPLPPSVAQMIAMADCPPDREEVVRTITELEHTAAAGQAQRDEPAEAVEHTVVVGFVIGQLAYAQHTAGHLLSNPTCYVCSFAVDPLVQRCGVGQLLLRRFIEYVTQQRPVYAQDCLHYDERKLIAMLADALVTRRAAHADGDVSVVSSRPGSGSSTSGCERVDEKDDDARPRPRERAAAAAAAAVSHLHNLVATYLPELRTWAEDRQARDRLRRRGLSESAIDAQRARDQLAHDSLTDEEALEVRRDAECFVVQIGVQDVWLHCLPANRIANTFYAHRGFVRHCTLREYYHINDTPYDAYLLRYTAPPAVPPPVSSTAATDVVEDDVAPATAEAEEEEEVPSALHLPPLSSAGLRRRRGHSRDVGTAGEASAVHTPDAVAATDAPPAPPSARTVTWLSPSTIDAVGDIILCSAAEGQRRWRQHAGGLGAGGAAEPQRGWWGTAGEVLLLVNALGLLGAVVWLAYNVGVTGKVE